MDPVSHTSEAVPGAIGVVPLSGAVFVCQQGWRGAFGYPSRSLSAQLTAIRLPAHRINGKHKAPKGSAALVLPRGWAMHLAPPIAL
jgi:hypothetical protein